MTSAELFDHLGRPIRLGQPLAKGGEGTVFEVASAPDLVAKVYHKVLPGRAEKLRAMLSLAREELLRVAAWPTATLHQQPGGPVVGLLMRRIKDFHEIHTLYSPANRKTAFPRADWKFLITVAMNCAALLENVHQCGVVVGDVNQSNLLVSSEGLVHLLDCDSCQIQANGQTYPCEVGVPLFTPPELQGQNFRALVRSPNHDRFGLAVLVFYLLFVNRHPFSGRFLGKGEMPIERAIGEYRFAYGRLAPSYEMQVPPQALTLSAVSPPVADLFERAFGPASARPDARPTGLEWFNGLNVFRQSLRNCPADPGHVYGGHLANCPWCELMKQGAPNFFVAVAYYKPTISPTGPVFVLATVLARIEQVRRPNLLYQRPPFPAAGRPTPLPAGVPAALPAKPAPPAILVSPPAPPVIVVPAPSRQRVIVAAGPLQRTVAMVAIVCGLVFLPFLFWLKGVGITALLAFVVFGVWWLVLERLRRAEMAFANRDYDAEVQELLAAAQRSLRQWQQQMAAEQARAKQQYEESLRPWRQAVAALREEGTRRKQAKEEAVQGLGAAEANWTAAASRWGEAFDRKKDELRGFGQRHKELAGEYAGERQWLQARGREMQREQYLQQHFLSDHAIPDIGPTRKATLASFGIETARDLTEVAILEVPGFGPKLTERLLLWRQEVESRFVFNATLGVPPSMQQALDAKYARARQQIEAKLLAGEGELQSLARQAEGELRSLYTHIGTCMQAVVQCELDLSLVPRN